MNGSGLFITVEGSEGAGKTTAMDYLEAVLRREGVELFRTREPGGTHLGERLRGILLDPDGETITPMAELLMIFAARAQHITQHVKPALARGQWVLCDRFTDATYAYQGAGRELGAAAVAQLEDLVQGGFRPDITLLMDLPVEDGLARARERGDFDRFEREDLAFFERVRAAYLSRAARGGGRYQVIDASAALEDVRAKLEVFVRELLAVHKGRRTPEEDPIAPGR